MTIKKISTRQVYTAALADEDVFRFSYNALGREASEAAELTVAATKFADLNPDDDPVICVQFTSGQKMYFDIEDRGLDIDDLGTELTISVVPSSYRLLELGQNKLLAYVYCTKEDFELWQNTTAGREEMSKQWFGATAPGVEYEIRERLKYQDDPWTDREILEDLSDIHGISVCITATERTVTKTKPVTIDWTENFFAVVKSLYNGQFVSVKYDSLGDTLFVIDVFDEPASYLSILENKPLASLDFAHPQLKDDAIFELMGGEVDFKAEDYKWGETWTQPLDPGRARLPIHNTYLRRLMSGKAPYPEDFFAIGQIGVLLKASADPIYSALSPAIQKRISDFYRILPHDNRLFRLAQDKSKELKVWAATRPFYFRQLKRQPDISDADPTSHVVKEVWNASNSVGEDMGVMVYARERRYEAEDDEEPLNGTATSKGKFLKELRETITFYEGMVPGVAKPVAKCKITMIGRRLVELRPAGFDAHTAVSAQYNEWYHENGKEFGHRASFFNSTAAAAANSTGSTGWTPQWVWEPNAGMEIEAWLYDERGYPVWQTKRVFGVTYEESGGEGNSGIDDYNTRPPEDYAVKSESGDGKTTIYNDAFYERGNSGDYLGGNGGSFGTTSGTAGAAAVDSQNKGNAHKRYELSRIQKLDKYSGISNNTFHWMILTNDGWTQDPRCLVSATDTFYMPIDRSMMQVIAMNKALVNGLMVSWQDEHGVPNNQLTKSKVEMIQQKCYYNVNFPEPGDSLEVVNAGQRVGMAHLTDWELVADIGARLHAQKTSLLNSYSIDLHGSFLIPAGTRMKFTTPQREIIRHGGRKETLSETTYKGTVENMRISPDSKGSMTANIAMRDFIGRGSI
ncbi:MAG: hypothetical protein JRI80_00145 [Deltaproteobacteria bacterium]|nr:hypothetical protein [Deltaproteobacteria bacterium]